MKPKSNEPFIVRKKIFESVKLIDKENSFVDGINTEDAIKMADERGLDLVCFSRPGSGGELPLCKIVDYGKWKYDNEKKKKKHKQDSHKNSTKELRFSPVIGDHDIDHKVRQAADFLENGNEVLFFMQLKGRQRAHFEFAEDKMNEIVEKCSGYGSEVSRKKTNSTIAVRISKISNKEKQK